jgi:hypothetical protein
VPGFTDDKEILMNDSTTKQATARRRGIVASAVAVAIGATLLTASPADGAVPAVDAAGAEQVLREAGVLADAPLAARSAGDTASAAASTSTSTLTLKAGLGVTTGTTTLQIMPIAGTAKSALSPSGLAVYGNDAHSSFVLGSAKTGSNAGYAVITGKAAPTSFQFLVSVDGDPAVLRLAETGGVDVLNEAGTLVNTFAPPWAKDASGAAVATSYAVVGNILTQTVEHGGAVYPVVADPRVRCDGLWCTAELTRGETRQMAAGAFAPGALCAWFGAAGRLCSTLILSGWAHANIALSTGQCSGFRVWQRNLVSYPHLAYIPCYA